MFRLAAQRLTVFVAFVAALLVSLCASGRAEAAILPTCDARDFVTTAPPPEPTAPSAEDACEAALRSELGSLAADDDVEIKVAAMCDACGASMIAPQRVHPISDARIDAIPGCH